MVDVENFVMFVIGILILSIIAVSQINFTVQQYSGYVFTDYTKEGIGQYNTTQTPSAVSHIPIQLAKDIKVYVNATTNGKDATTLLDDGNNITYSRTTGVINIAGIFKEYNNSYFNVTYTGASNTWDSGTTNIFNILPLLVIVCIIMFVIAFVRLQL